MHGSENYSRMGVRDYKNMDKMPMFKKDYNPFYPEIDNTFYSYGPRRGPSRFMIGNVTTDGTNSLSNMDYPPYHYNRRIDEGDDGDGGYSRLSSVEGFKLPPHINNLPNYSGISGQGSLPPFQVKNSTFWPSYYYAYPYDESTYAWPTGLFSRSYNIYPGFSTGTGLSMIDRPLPDGGSNNGRKMPRDAWIRNTQSNGTQRYYVSNRGEYQFNESNYKGF